MIDTDLKFCESELNEVINMFSGAESLKIRHIFDERRDRVVNTVVIGGKSYAFGNLLPDIKDGIERKRYIKRYAKLSLYKALSAVTGISLPWGALTGIRPTKLAYQQSEKTGEFRDFFINTMKVSEQKTDLVEKVLKSQRGIYEKDDNNTDFFVFIPFCPSRCRYCSFISADIKGAAKYVDEYVGVLISEIRESARYIKKLRSIYIGGGTPVALDNAALEKILKETAKINTGVEFTVEAGRPDRITEDNLKLFRDYGVTRICINPQTFNDRTLELLGRKHTASQVEEKFMAAKDLFVTNMDLIAGLTGESLADFRYSLDKAVSLAPDNITVHTLCIKRGSALAEGVKRLGEGEVSKMLDYAGITLAENGYNPYYLYRQKYMAGNLENVGYCREGKACIYNIDVMEEISSTVACGANAISKRVTGGGEKIERAASPKDVKTYIEKIQTIMSAKDKLFS